MAKFSVGDVTFGLGADIRGLDKARSAMQQFGRDTDRVASSQVQGANAAVAAMAKQEAAMRKALNTTVALQKQLRESNAPVNLIAQTTNSFNALTRALTTGVVNASDYSRALDRFKVSTDKVKASLKQIEPPVGKVRTFSDALRDLQSASVFAAGPLSGIGTRISAFASITSRSTLAMAGFTAGATAVGVVMYKLSAAALKTALEVQRINSALYASAGTTTATAHEFQYITGVSRKLGLELASTATAYSQFAAAVQGTALEGAKSKAVFEGTATAAAALKLSAADTEGVFRALTQMMSKGTVQAEELRGQLGDRIPGAFRDAAAAMGVSEAKLGSLMKKGEVLSEDLLPKLAERWKAVYGDAAAKSADGLQAAINNTATAQTLFNVAFDETFRISELATKSLQLYTKVLDYLTGSMNGTAAATTKFGQQVLKDTNDFIGVQGKAVTASKDRVTGYIADVADMKYRSTMLTNKLKDDLETQIKMQKELSSGFSGKIATWGGGTSKRDAEIEATKKKIAEQEAMVKQAEEQLKALRDIETKAKEGGSGAITGDNPGTTKPKLDKFTEINDSLQVTIERTKELNSLPDYWLGGTKSLEEFNKGLSRGKQLEAFKDKLILAGVSQDVFNKKVAEFNRVMDESDAAEKRFDQIQAKAEALEDLGGGALDSFGTFLEDINDDTKSVAESWSDMVDSIIKDLQRWAIQQQVIQPLKDLISGSGSSGGGFLSAIVGGLGSALGGWFGSSSTGPATSNGVTGELGSVLDGLYNSSVTGGGRAGGGNVNAGQSYMVGEQGPERFVPNTSGHILSNDAAFSGGIQMSVNIYNNTNSTVSAKQSSDGKSMEITIDESVAKAISSVGTRSNKAVRNVGTRMAGR